LREEEGEGPESNRHVLSCELATISVDESIPVNVDVKKEFSPAEN
jgi:hypothetical protein